MLAGPNFDIGAALGTQAGANLFHSFTHFNINTGESATFSGPASIDNVISRVTGGSLSNIDGLLSSTIPGADVFLINPSGILFGPNASLDVDGSFHASTADQIRFPDAGVFDATNPGATVLSVAEPSAFGFLDNNPGSITVDRADLAVPVGATLSLVGGDISISGLQDGRATITAASGRRDAFVNMIEAAGDLIEAGLIADACGQLRSALRRVDGDPRPPDFVTGADAALIAD